MDVFVQITFQELCEQEGGNDRDIAELVKHGIVQPVSGSDMSSWVFLSNDVTWIHKALRLQRDLDIGWVATGMVIDLLRKNQALTREQNYLKQRLQRFCEDESLAISVVEV